MQRDEPITAVVIGSGFGGSVAALRLGQAGIDTAVLERGRAWPITERQDTFCTYRKPDGRAAWLSPQTVVFKPTPIDVYTGIMERRDDEGMTVLCAAGVGGGSLVYNCVLYQPPRELFTRVFPASVDYDEMDQVYYPRVRELLKPAQIPEDILNSSYYLSTRRFLEQAQAAGLPHRLLDVAVDWDIIREEIKGTRQSAAIVGEIWYGINSGVKNSLDRNYLVQAQETKHVEILPLHVVTGITEVPEHGFRIAYNQINESGAVVSSGAITCRHLFLAAGSYWSSALLVKAKATGALPRLNEHIGQQWGNNGDTFATQTGLGTTNPGQGGPAGGLIQHFDNPVGPISLIGYPEWDAPEGTLTSLGMTIPADRGSFRYDGEQDRVWLTYPAETPGVKRLVEAANYTYNILDEANAREYQHHFHGTVVHRTKTEAAAGMTAHPLGGAVLGKACDLYGRVEGYRGLYVVDGALIPGSTATANPAYTIAAMAERCMDRIVPEIAG